MHGFTTEYARLNLGDKPGDPPGIFLTGVKVIPVGHMMDT
jgi:hypothetical protein